MGTGAMRRSFRKSGWPGRGWGGAVRRWCGLASVVVAQVGGASWEVTRWDFNSAPSDGWVTTGSLRPVTGWGRVSAIGGVVGSFVSGAGSSDPAGVDNSAWRLTHWPDQGHGNKSRGYEIWVNTVGWEAVSLLWDQRTDPTASRYWRIQFSTNGTDWVDGPAWAGTAGGWQTNLGVPVPPWGWDQPVLGIRMVSEFEASAVGRGVAGYVAAGDRWEYSPAGAVDLDHVRVLGWPGLRAVRLVTWNLAGFGMTNWTSTHPQLVAAVRVLRALAPDVVALQEIPEGWEPGLSNWVAGWWPGATVMVGSRADGALRMAVASRLPVQGVRSWLRRSPLAVWGHDGVFTRELLEAEVWVPGAGAPLHLFSMHLKAGADEESATRRAAEARAISNFFVVEWPERSLGRGYVLVGDANEDVTRPRAGEQGVARILSGAETGLQWLTPVNPWTGDDRTWSSREAGLRYRFDYLLVGGWVASNVVESGVFRSDVGGLDGMAVARTDSAVASDHLPVWGVFANPHAAPRLEWELVGREVWVLRWWSGMGQRYRLETSEDLTAWAVAAEVEAERPGWVRRGVEGNGAVRFFRLMRLSR